MSKLEGRIGIVTGASSGIGYAAANVPAESSAVVYTISRTGAVKGGLPSSVGDIMHVKGGVTNAGEMNASISSITAGNGLGLIVNNAGITKRYRARQFPTEEPRDIMEMNVTSLSILSRICYPYLTESRFRGRIININSMAAHLGFIEMAPYYTSKATVCGLTRGLVMEWASDNIYVSSITPSRFPSEISKQAVIPKRKAAILTRMSIHTFGDPRGLGEVVKFLLSDHAKYITGQDFAVDGGASAHRYQAKKGQRGHSTPRRPLPITIPRIIPY